MPNAYIKLQQWDANKLGASSFLFLCYAILKERGREILS